MADILNTGDSGIKSSDKIAPTTLNAADIFSAPNEALLQSTGKTSDLNAHLPGLELTDLDGKSNAKPVQDAAGKSAQDAGDKPAQDGSGKPTSTSSAGSEASSSATTHVETLQVKPSDSLQNPPNSENLAVPNQASESAKPGVIQQANATASANLESSGELPKITIVNSADSAVDSAVATNKSQPAAQASAPVASDTPATNDGSVLVANDLKQLNSTISGLKTDEQALAKDPHSAQDLSKVNADEATLKTDEQNYMHASAASSTYADYSQSMAADHAEVKGIATSLWDMGQKTDASETTAYYPTSHYEKYFNNSTGTGPGNPGNPGNPGGPTLKDETSDTNLQDDNWKTNNIASEIGGKGINPNMQLSTSDGALTATMSGGSYTDGLISNTQKYNPNDNTVQLAYNATIKPGSDLHAMEMDEAITGNKQADGKTLTAMAASQFVMNPKTGTMEFDTSGTNHGWDDAVNNIPIPADGKMDVSMTVKMVGNTYEYTGLTVNGKTYAINPDASTFQATQLGSKGWTPDSVHVQMQQDLGSAGGSSTITYNDVQVNQGNT